MNDAAWREAQRALSDLNLERLRLRTLLAEVRTCIDARVGEEHVSLLIDRELWDKIEEELGR